MKRLLFVVILVAMAAPIQAADPFAGTWNLNVAKSGKDALLPKEVIVIATEKGIRWSSW
jgi:hypothetical protein